METTEYSVPGKYHLNKGICCQDYILHSENQNFMFFALADGVSTQEKSYEGAKIACKTAAQLFMRNDKLFLQFSSEKAISLLIDEIRYMLQICSSEEKCSIECFSSTLSFVLIDKSSKDIYFFNLGDGICLTTFDEKISVINAPCDSSNGCYVTTTKYVDKSVRFVKSNCYIFDSVVLMSDGAWQILYEKGVPKEDYRKELIGRSYKQLIEKYDSEEKFDDCSFIAIDISKMRKKGKL